MTESLFSMDGDRAPLKELADLASRYGASLYIDEAHALGTCGPEGKGLWEECRQKNPDVLSEEAVVRLGTLGKAFGSFGAFVLSGTTVTEFLMNRARSFIFTTALPPAVVAASQKGVELAAAEPALRERLWKNVARLASGLDQPITAPISPFLYPGNKPVMAAAKKLFEAGLYVQGIRSPTVPAGKERLRITISTHHTEAQIDKLAEVLKGL